MIWLKRSVFFFSRTWFHFQVLCYTWALSLMFLFLLSGHRKRYQKPLSITAQMSVLSSFIWRGNKITNTYFSLCCLLRVFAFHNSMSWNILACVWVTAFDILEINFKPLTIVIIFKILKTFLWQIIVTCTMYIVIVYQISCM